MAKLTRPLASHLRLRPLRRYDHAPPRTHPRTQLRRSRMATHPVFLQSWPPRSSPTANRPLPTSSRLADVVRCPFRRTGSAPRLVQPFPQKTPYWRSRCLESSPSPDPLFRKRLSPPSSRPVPLHRSCRKILHRKLVANHSRPRSSCSHPRNFSLNPHAQL